MANRHLPGYSPLLNTYHAAFARELQIMISELPLCAGDQVLDMGCGDGAYSAWLAQEVAPGGQVTGVDISPAYLAVARRKLKRHPLGHSVRFVRGDIRRLPFQAGTFNAAWCAQSFYTFEDPLKALVELTRVTRRGGIVAVLENDSFHQVLLPWPADIELALCQAEYQALQARQTRPRKYYVGRNLRELFAKAGLKPQRKKLYASQREVPLAPQETRFLKLHLQGLWERTRSYLEPAQYDEVEAYMNPRSPAYLLKRPELTLTCLDHLVWGKKP
jgi:ubiquinone/menaquinone biosynthesis C-methylase UbiE